MYLSLYQALIRPASEKHFPAQVNKDDFLDIVKPSSRTLSSSLVHYSAGTVSPKCVGIPAS